MFSGACFLGLALGQVHALRNLQDPSFLPFLPSLPSFPLSLPSIVDPLAAARDAMEATASIMACKFRARPTAVHPREPSGSTEGSDVPDDAGSNSYRCLSMVSFSSMTAKSVEPSWFQKKNRIFFSWGWQQKRIEAFHAFVLAT